MDETNYSNKSGHNNEDVQLCAQDDGNVDVSSQKELSIQEKIKTNVFGIRAINKKSWVWKYFGHVYDIKNHTELDYIACRLCKVVYKIDAPTQSTGRINIHLKKKHNLSDRKNEHEDASGTSKVKRLDSFTLKAIPSVHAEKIIDSVLKFSVDRCLPFDVCGSDSMADIISACFKIDGYSATEKEKVFKLPDESTFRKLRFPQKYDKILESVKTKINLECNGHGGITFDLWSDKYHKRKYIGVTLHYLDEQFQMHCFCLACRQIFENRVDNNVIAKVTSSILMEYGLDPKNMIFVTDSGSDVKKACGEARGWNRIACFAHDLHLLVACDGLTSTKEQRKHSEIVMDSASDSENEPEFDDRNNLQIQQLIKSCRSLVNHFIRGNGQRRLESKGGTTLKIDVLNRWNSTYTMLKSVEENYEKIFEVLLEMKQEKLASGIDRRALAKLISFLKPFFDLTVKFSSQSRETLASVWPTVTGLRQFLASYSVFDALDIESDEDNSMLSDLDGIKSKMLQGLTSVVGRRHQRLMVSDYHKIASFLDPRLKRLPFATREEREDVNQCVLKEMQLVARELSKSPKILEAGETSSSAATTDLFGVERFYNFGSMNEYATNSVEVDAKRELESYLNVNFANGYDQEAIKSANFPLTYWKEKGNRFPTLQVVARKYLAVPATSVPSEQVFSLAGRITTDRRAMMTGDTVAKSVFCKKNISLW